MFHVELRQFPHVARAFNLSHEELDQRFLRPWVSGTPITLNERRWTNEKARLTIYEGPGLATEDMGMGRGWGNVTKSGHDVTQRLLAEAQETTPAAVMATEAERFKQELAERCTVEPQTLHSVLLRVIERYPEWRISERIALAERAVWELLHQQRVAMIDADATEPVPRERWQEKLLAWDSWAGERVALIGLRQPAPG